MKKSDFMKKFAAILLALLLGVASVITCFAKTGNEAKESQELNVNDDFVDNQVLVLLTVEETAKGIKYTTADFAEYGVTKLEQHLLGDMTWLILTLNKHGKQNVIDVI